jgi:methylmalonyl-CoA/ethylmalonyl-CoA epimerase
MLSRIDHVGIACRSLEAAIERYEGVFGLTVVSRETNEEQGVREAMLSFPGGANPQDSPAYGETVRPPVSPLAPGYIQLLEPLSPDSPVGRFLERHGEGMHHVGYAVESVTAALAAIGERGVRLIDTRPRHGSMGASIAFLHPGDLGGVLTELVQPAPNALYAAFALALPGHMTSPERLDCPLGSKQSHRRETRDGEP